MSGRSCRSTKRVFLTKEPDSQDASAQKPKRKPLTIDLPAEEIGRKAAAESASDAESGLAQPYATAATASVPGDNTPPGMADAPDKNKEPPPADPVTPSAFTGRKTGATTPPPPKWRPIDEPPPPPPPRPFMPLLIAAVLGGIVGAAIIFALMLGGFFGQRDDTALVAEVNALKGEIASARQAQPPPDLAPLEQQVAALEKSVGELSKVSPDGSPDAAMTELQARVAALEQTGGAGGATAELEQRIAELGDQVAALRNAQPADAASLEEALAPLREQVGTLAARVDAAPTAERIATLEQMLDDVSRQVGAATALAPAIAADALEAALESGRPFSTELAALKNLGADPAALEVLSSRAADGLPTMAQLRSGFEAAIASVELTAPIPEATGTIDRLWQSARGLVEVRPTRPTVGADPSAVVARIRAALAAGDLKAALAEREALPETIKAATADWASAADARVKADDLVAAVRAEALAKLGTGQ